ncbi:MAG: metallophosphoesterase [Marinilabiliales bacterium]|nr:MAG: metallophosphoesterase [Marinilabiliales bacterium]
MFPVLVFALFVLLVDLYAYKGLKVVFDMPSSGLVKTVFRVLYWLVPVILFLAVIHAVYSRPADPSPAVFNRYYYIVAYTLLFYIPKLVFTAFHLLEDLILLLEKIAGLVKLYFKEGKFPSGEVNAPRRKFLSRAGIIIAILPFLAIIYGVAVGRFDFRVSETEIRSPGIPVSFDGYRIVHISDLHIGSFHGYPNRVRQAVEIINRQQADVIVFTGDLVNNFTAELEGFTGILGQLNAPHGVYSVLGNHDYGDYFQWESEAQKKANMKDMFAAQEKMGWRLLMNEWEPLVINNDTIVLAGVENWGEPPFPRYGDLEEALDGTCGYPFVILLSHDPTHWDARVLGKSNVDLTLSGHTHGMQVGIETAVFRWSPSRMRYPRWGGLYVENGQFLYVNRGLGYVAFPGRIGMPPEITVIELKSGI